MRENAPGIHKKIQNKISHLFFTTKSTGEGSGLGLSLSNNIIKAHSGEIKVAKVKGEDFIVQLPITKI